MVLATTSAVGLRIWVRFSRGHPKVTASDLTIGITGILGLICGATATSLLALTMGGPMTPAQEVLHMKLTIVAMVNYWVLAWMVKGSFLSLYWDLRSRLNKELRWTLIISTFYTIATFFVVLLTNLLWCQPIHNLWTVPGTDPGYCFFVNHTTLIIYAVCHLTSDIPLIWIPIRLVRFLKLSRTDMWGMALVAVVGSISIIISIVRFAALYAAVNDNNMDAFLLKTFVWSCIEETAGQCASCLPAFRVLLRRRSNAKNGSSIGYPSRVSNVVRSKMSALHSNNADDPWEENELQKLATTTNATFVSESSDHEKRLK